MKIEHIKTLCDNATPGPWKYDCGNLQIEVDNDDLDRLPIVDICRSERIKWAEHRSLKDKNDYDSDGEFIAYARELMPKLLKVAIEAKKQEQTWELAAALEDLEK